MLVVTIVYSLRNLGRPPVAREVRAVFSEQAPPTPEEKEAIAKKEEAMAAFAKRRKSRSRVIPPAEAAVTRAPGRQGAKKGQPAVPAVLSWWEDADFLRAHEADDPRLAAAVEQRARNPQRTMAEAEMLESLLTPAGPARRGWPAGEGEPGAPAKVMVHAVAVALGANETAAARQTLARLLAGEFPALPPEAVAEDATVALLRQGSPASDQIVLHHLVAAPSARQEAIVAAVHDFGSARLRKLLAKAVIEGLPQGCLRHALLVLLCEPNPLNLEAQVLLYQDASADAAMRAGLEKQFLAASTAAVRGLLGVGDQQAGRGLGPAAYYHAAGQLWGPPLTEFLDRQHRGLGAMGERPAAVALALTIPNQALRIRLRRTLSRHWSEGPQALRAAGVPGEVLVEPGVPAVLKSLIRESQRAKLASVKAVTPSHAHGKQINAQRMRPSEPPRTAPDRDWDLLTWELVMDYCRRCHVTALARSACPDEKAISADRAAPVAGLPLESDSAVCEAYHVAWPGIHAGHLPQAAGAAWQLDYVRIEERAKPSRPAYYYRRRLKGCVVHLIPHGVWLDGFTEKEEGGVQSIDVVITHAGAATGPPADEEQELTIQILSMDLGSLRE
jgi:hypothetical protein